MVSEQKIFEINIQALHNLYPNTHWTLCGKLIWKQNEDGQFVSDNLDWEDNSSYPVKDDVEQEIARLVAEWENTDYQRLRALEYPPLSELADALYWQSQGDDSKMTAYLAKVEAVKQKYPKE